MGFYSGFLLFSLSHLATLGIAGYCAPSPAFPVPLWNDVEVRALETTFRSIDDRLERLTDTEEFKESSYSIAVTSNTDTLWSGFRTAKDRNASRIGTKEVDEDGQYRVASITKVFTVLGILKQHAAGNLSLDDSINKYVAGLPSKGRGGLPWKDITLRILASQLSGIPNDFAQSDMINGLDDPTIIGLPLASRELMSACDELKRNNPCNSSDLLETIDKRSPTFAPNFQATYSNIAYELLGLAIENVTGSSYNDYIKHAIFEDLGMSLSSLEKPSDKHAVIPKGRHFWDVDEGIQGPAGGSYNSLKDLSIFARYIMTHFNTIATGVNWLQPQSWTFGLNSFYGMPFEIFRTDKLLEDTERPVTFVTKGGAVPGYFSLLILLPEYGLSVTIMIAGGPQSLLDEVREVITVELVRGAEDAIWTEMRRKYSGKYSSVDKSLDSSMTLYASSSNGLYATSFVSNGSDILGSVIPERFFLGRPIRAQLVPTLLYKDEENQRGEIFRMLFLPGPEPDQTRKVWDDFCPTEVDQMRYAGRPLNELVFWHDQGILELPTWELNVTRNESNEFETNDEQQLPLKLEL